MENLKVNMNNKSELFKQMELFKNEDVEVDYDGKTFKGKVEDIYIPKTEDWNNGVLPGFIIHNEKREYKHIKIRRVEKITSEKYILMN